MRKFGRIILVSVLSVATAAIAFAAWVLFTTRGSAWATRVALATALHSETVTFTRMSGALARGFSLHGVEATGLPRVPPGSRLSIQRIDARVSPRELLRSRVNIFNGRLTMPDEEPILFSGSYDGGALDVNASTPAITIQRLLQQLADLPQLATMQGTAKDVAIHVVGPLGSPRLTGTANVEQLTRDHMVLEHCPAHVDLVLRPHSNAHRLTGEAGCDAGTVTVKRLHLQLEPSRLAFKGDPGQPRLRVHAITAVEDTKIRINITGTPNDPHVRVASSPPRPPDQLLLMLATGRNWTQTEQAMKDGQISLSAAQEMIGYLTGGSGPKLNGVDVSLSQNANERGVGVSKSVSSKLKVGYSVEQSTQAGTEGTVTQRVSAQRQLSDDAALQLEAQQDPRLSVSAPPDVYVKYKQQF